MKTLDKVIVGISLVFVSIGLFYGIKAISSNIKFTLECIGGFGLVFYVLFIAFHAALGFPLFVIVEISLVTSELLFRRVRKFSEILYVLSVGVFVLSVLYLIYFVFPIVCSMLINGNTDYELAVKTFKWMGK